MTAPTTAIDGEEVMRLALAAVRQYLREHPGLPQSVHDDVVSDAMFGAASAAGRWTPGRGANPATFVRQRAYGAIVDGRRQAAPVSRAEHARGVQLEELPAHRQAAASLHVLAEAGVDIADQRDAIEDLVDQMTVEQLLEACTATDRQVLTELYLRGRTAAAVAADLDVHAVTVKNWAQRALTRLRYLQETTMSALIEPVHRAIATRARRGQTADQLYSVGERTGWWTGDDVDWCLTGGEGPRPAGWTLDAALQQPAAVAAVTLEAPDGQLGTLIGPASKLADIVRPEAVIEGPALLVREAQASTALDGQTFAVEEQPAPAEKEPPAPEEDSPRTAPVTVDVGEVAPPASSYVHVVRTDEVFIDHTYQRPLDPARVKKMTAEWNPRLVAVIDVSDRGEGSPPGRRFAAVNGQHRWAAARALDVEHLVATIHEGLTPAAEAQLMYDLDRGTKALSTWDRWKTRRAAGDPVVAQVEAVATAAAMAVTPAGYGAIGASERLIAAGGRDLLQSTVSVLVEAWGPTAAAVKAPFLLSVGNLLHRYAEHLDVPRLVGVLQRTSPQQLHARADALREADGGSLRTQLTRAIVGKYNAAPGPGLRLTGSLT